MHTERGVDNGVIAQSPTAGAALPVPARTAAAARPPSQNNLRVPHALHRGSAARQLGPDAAGIGLFIALLAVGAAWPVALAVGAAGYVARRLMLRPPPSLATLRQARQGRKAAALPLANSAEVKSVRRITGEARATITRIRSATGHSSEAPLRSKSLALCGAAERVVDELERHPGNVTRSRQSLRYLEAAEHILTRSESLAAKGRTSLEVEQTLDRVGPALDALSDAFREQLDCLLREEALDLDADLTVLQKTVQLDGFTPRAPPPQSPPSQLGSS